MVSLKKKNLLGITAAIAFALGGASMELHATTIVSTLHSVSHASLPSNKQQLELEIQGDAVLPRTFTIDNPPRIILDFPNTSLGIEDKITPIGQGVVKNVTTVEANGRTRVVINIATMVPYKTELSDGKILVSIDPSSSDATHIDQPASPIKQIISNEKQYENDRSVTGVNFRRGPSGEGRVILDLSKPGIPIDVQEEGERIIISFAGASINNDLIKRLDVLDFGTPVKFIDTRSTRDGARIVIQPTNSSFEHLAYQSDNKFTLELKPMLDSEIDERRKKKFGFTGEKLSLNFQDIEVRSVLQLLADFTELNIVVSDNVDGKLTLRLKNVPWDQALDIILKSKNLGKRQAGNIIMVAPAEEIAARERIELESQQQKVELSPLRSEFFQINYAKAEELSDLLKSENGGGILSERGTVAVDARTNTILVNDTADTLEQIHSLISRLDIPVRQVLIESRIVVATDDFNKELGFRMGVNRNTTGDDGEGFVVSGNNSGVDHLIDNEALVGDERFNVNLPAANVAGSIGIALAKLPFGSLLELELSAMQAEGVGEVISSPRIITANQHEAFIEQGVEIPYLEASSSGSTSVSFRKAVLALKVIPHITPDDRIIMDLTVNKDTVGEIFGKGDFRIPSIDTREVSTQVLVDNGETVVLGGVYEQELLDQTNKVPFFGDLPFIGRLFKHTVKDDNKSELLIFVTPKIVRENTPLGY